MSHPNSGLIHFLYHLSILFVSDPPSPPKPPNKDVGKTEVSVPFTTKQALSNGQPVRSVLKSSVSPL